MLLRENASQRISKTGFVSGKPSRNSLTSNLTNHTSTLKPKAAIESHCSKNAFRGSTISTAKFSLSSNSRIPTGNSRQFSFQREKNKTNSANLCYCNDCAPLDDVPSHHLKELQDQIRTLTSEISHEKNENQMLKRTIFMAKKVIKTEVGDNRVSFDNILEKVNEDGWMGRKEIIFELKRKVRDLNEMVKRLENVVEVSSGKKNLKSEAEESPELIPDDRQFYWSLELEKREVLKAAERCKQQLVSSRDLMKNHLQPLIRRNDEVEKEASRLRKEISLAPKSLDKGITERLKKLEIQFRTELDGKVTDKGKIAELELQNCRNCKNTIELKAKVSLEKQIIKDKEGIVNSLKKKEDALLHATEEVKREKIKNAVMMRKKLEDMKEEYNSTALNLENILTLMTNSKRALVETNLYSRYPGSFVVSKDKMKAYFKRNLKDENIRPIKRQFDDETGFNYSLSFENVPKKNNGCSYEHKLSKYRSILEVVQRKNCEKTKQFYFIIEETQDMILKFLKERYVLWKIMSDIDIQKSRVKKLKKVANRPSKMKLAKKKESLQLLTQVSDERKFYLSIMRKESKCLKTLIRRVYVSKDDDFELFTSYLSRNKKYFFRTLSQISSAE